LKNIRGQVDGKIEHYRTILVRLRDDFLARAAVTTEVTVLRMQDDVSNTIPVKQGRSAQLNGYTVEGDVEPGIRSRCVIVIVTKSSDRRPDRGKNRIRRNNPRIALQGRLAIRR
jgi:hypothetical protein